VKPRLLFLSTWFPHPLDNGYKIRVHYLLHALSASYDVTLLAFAFGTSQPSSCPPPAIGCTEVHTVLHNPFHRSALAWSLRFLSPRPVVETPVREMVSRAGQLLRRNSYHAVVASTTQMAPYSREARGSALILEEHNCWSRWARERAEGASGPSQRIHRWASWKKRRSYDRRVFNRFDLCTVVSDVDRNEILSLWNGAPDCVAVVPNGVDCSHNRPGLAQATANIMVYNGSLTYRANLDAVRWFLAKVYPLIRSAQPQARLVITGSTDGVDLDALPLDSSVQLTGNVPDVRYPVSSAAVCIVPTRVGSGTRIKLLEAMALGTPVVATSKGAEGIEAIDGQHLLLADEPADFADCTLRLLSGAGLRVRLAGSARRLVEERYGWDAIGEHFVEMVNLSASCRGSRIA